MGPRQQPGDGVIGHEGDVSLCNKKLAQQLGFQGLEWHHYNSEQICWNTLTQ